MTLTELYEKLNPAQHPNVHVCGNAVVYDNGTTIYEAYLEDRTQELIPRTAATRNALNAL